MINLDVTEIVKISISTLAFLLSIVGIILSVKISKVQKRISGLSVTASYFKDLRTWASEAIEVCHQVTHQLKQQETATCPEISDQQLGENYKNLSIVIDKGRLFLPNKQTKDYRNDKPAAYQGLRHSGLDPLVAIAQIISNQNNPVRYGFTSKSEPVHYLTREFVSEIQTILKTVDFNKNYSEIWKLSQESKKKSEFNLQINTREEETPSGVSGTMAIIAARHKKTQQQTL